MCRECRRFDPDAMAFIDTAPQCLNHDPTGAALAWLYAAIFLAACMVLAAL